MAVGQPAVLQRTRSWRKASRLDRPDLDTHARATVATGPGEEGKGRGGQDRGERRGDTPVTRSHGNRSGFLRSRRSAGRRPSLRTEGKLRRAGKASRGRTQRVGEATRRAGESENGMNPRVGSALQHTRPASEEQAVEVVENHEGGTWRHRGRCFPKVRFPRGGFTGSGLRCRQDDGGAIFGQSQERQSSRAIGWTDGDGRCRARRRRRPGGLRRRGFTHARAARAEVLEDEPACMHAGQRPEGGGKADVPRLRTGRSPHLAARSSLSGDG
jgi:hypothetical protein